MEKVKAVKMKLHIETNKRTVKKEFDNLFDLKLFVNDFFSYLADPESKNHDPNTLDRKTGWQYDSP